MLGTMDWNNPGRVEGKYAEVGRSSIDPERSKFLTSPEMQHDILQLSSARQTVVHAEW